jgi:hypothetical protein
MTSTETLDLASYASKKVNLTFRDDEDKEVTKEGTISAASAIGLVFKEKGKADVDIVQSDSIISIEELAEKPGKVQVKKLQPVTKNYRQHLADRHGYLPADLNKLTEEQGKEIHDGIDHSELAHKHEVPKAQQDAEGAESGDTESEDEDA